MGNEQTPHDVLVAHQRQDISSCICGWSELGHSFCQHQIDALDAAEFAIVRKPTGDREAHQYLLPCTCGAHHDDPRCPRHAAALAAAEAVKNETD